MPADGKQVTAAVGAISGSKKKAPRERGFFGPSRPQAFGGAFFSFFLAFQCFFA